MKQLILVIYLFFSSQLMASHIVGGDIYYDYLGNNQYKFYISLYRDCFSSGASFDSPLQLGVFTANNASYLNVSVPFPGSTNLPLVFTNPCVNPPTDVCVEKAVYTTILTLPPTPGGYTVAYQRCCRGPNVTNLVNPDDTGLTLVAHVPGSETGFTVNSSPRYVNYPPFVLCNNDDLVFNHYATDPDGDQLVYSLVTPHAGANSNDPAPNPIPSPNYPYVVWGNSFSAANPLGPGASINIDANTGVLTADPNLTGLFVVGIRVQELRNGVVVGETVRDFLFHVINCNISMQATFPEQEDMAYFESYCQGLTVTFDNNSYGATNYLWDFGVEGITSDQSSSYEPTYTYPQPGTYEVMLIGNPGFPCTDTAYQTIIVNQELEVSYTVQDSACVIGNSFDFDGSVVGTNSATYSWDFGPSSSLNNETTLDVNGVSFTSTGYIPVTLNGFIGTCHATFTDSVYVIPFPNVSFAPPPNYLCEGLTLTPDNTSTDVSYVKWDFGHSNSPEDQSSLFEPTYTYSTPGTYTISLIGGSEGVCIDTATQQVVMNEILDVWFTHNDSLCITYNSFDFDGEYIGSPTSTFTWDFGPNASISTSSNLDEFGVVFSETGIIPITLTANYENCVATAQSQIFIFREPEINFTIQPGLQCAPFMAHFIDLCIADSPLLYAWTFGDGGTSTEANPSYLYNNVGQYSVGLTITPVAGCTDVLFLTQPDLVNVHPNPVSAFDVTPKVTDICHSKVDFIDLSTGASAVSYSFDGVTGSNDPNPYFWFPDDGMYYPKQIVVNEWGCSDTSYQQVFIEPYTVYIPNAFTPDGNEFNNTFDPIAALPAIEWEFRVYNRWGQMIFESTDQNLGWDGFYKDQMAQDGLYTYTLRYISCENLDAWHVLTGHFSLLR